MIFEARCRPAPKCPMWRLAIYEGADAVMLSAESAAGPISGPGRRHHEPHSAIEVEADPTYRAIIHGPSAPDPEATGADANRGCGAPDRRNPRSQWPWCCWTSSRRHRIAGRPRAARSRRSSRFPPNVATGRRLAIVWGVHSVVADDARRPGTTWSTRACRIVFKDSFARGGGERIIIVAGVPFGTPGATNIGAHRLRWLRHPRQSIDFLRARRLMPAPPANCAMAARTASVLVCCGMCPDGLPG